MLKRVNWYVLLGAFFIVVGVLNVFIGRWIEAGWCLTLGIGNFFVAYAQAHPAWGRGRIGWAVTIVFVVILAYLTILKFRQS